jgi:hypothetical protein
VSSRLGGPLRSGRRRLAPREVAREDGRFCNRDRHERRPGRAAQPRAWRTKPA